jgi:hypothetical protein
MLVHSESLPKQSSSAIAHDRVSNFSARHHAEARRRTFRQAQPVGDETAVDGALAFLTHAREIAALLDAHRGGKFQTLGRGHEPERLCNRPTSVGAFFPPPLREVRADSRPRLRMKFRPASGVCGLRDGGCAKWRGRSWCSCGPESRAAVCGESWTVDTVVS